jgi:hypothetical protein
MALAVAVGLAVAKPALAAAPDSGDAITVVVADGAGLRGPRGGTAGGPDGAKGSGVDLARSLVALIAVLDPDRPIAFIDSERPSQVFGPLNSRDPAFSDMLTGISAELAAGSEAGEGLFEAVAEASTLLGLERAGPGSRVLVVLGGESEEDFAALVPRLTPLVGRLTEQGFGLDVALTSERDADAALFAQRLADVGGGSVIDVTGPRTLTAVAENLLSRAGAGLDALGESRLVDGEVLSLPVDVVPGSVDLQVVVFKDDVHGSVRLVDPDGLEADRTGSNVVSSPFVVAWTVQEPSAGAWRLEASGIDGLITVLSGQSNGLTLALESTGPVALGEPVDLVARVTQSGPVESVAAGAELFAHVTSPSGRTLTYLLRDDGVTPDAVAGDLYFSASAAPLLENGDYDVVLELVWQDASYRVTSQYSIRAQPFPVLDVVPVLVGDLVAGERTLVATASVNVDGQPYPVSSSAIRWEFSGTAYEGQVVEIVPRAISSAGQGWNFDVFATVAEAGNSALTLRLAVEYVGRPFVHTAESVVISVPAPPIAPVPEQAEVEIPDATPVEESSSFPWWVLTFPALVALGLAWTGIRWLLAAAPVGYLYDDRQKRLVDFSALSRGPLAHLLSRDRVSGRELGVPGLDGITFVFERGKVAIRTKRPSTSVRVDSKPLFEEATLGASNWIGTGGRVYSFLLKPPAPTGEAASGTG